MRAFGLVLLGFGIIGSAMGQRATDSNFELVEDTTVTLDSTSKIMQVNFNFASFNPGTILYDQIANAEPRFDSTGFHYAAPYDWERVLFRMKLLQSDLSTPASNLAECVEAINAMGTTFKQIMNDQDPGYDTSIFVGFDQKMYDANGRGCIWGYLPGPGDSCPIGGNTNTMGFGTALTSPCPDVADLASESSVHIYVRDIFANNGDAAFGEVKAYKAVSTGGGGGGGGSSCVTGGDGDFSLNEAAYCTCDNDCISGSCVNDECTAPAPNTNCLNSLGLRILGTKCGCDDDCAGNNVCLDNTCVDSSYSTTAAATTIILDNDASLSSNDYGAEAVPTVDVAAVFSGVSVAEQRQALRRNLVKQLKNKGGSAALHGIKVALSDLNLDAGTGKTFIENLMSERGASQITIRAPKDKSAHTLGDTDTAACAAADFTESDTDVVECTHTEDGDVCLRCDSGALVSKTVFNADTNDYSVYCHDGSVWGTASTKLAGETYTCSLNDKTYESAIFSETGGGGSTAVCVEVGQRVLMSDGTHKNVEHLVPGDVLRTPEGITTVRSTRRGGRHLSQVHDVECAGQKGSITGNHAYHCEGEWRLAQETHEPRALSGTTEVVAVETDNYCEDRMILEGGLHVETWDGRGINEWRPHSFENGRRLRCTLKGSWRDQVLQRMDSKQ